MMATTQYDTKVDVLLQDNENENVLLGTTNPNQLISCKEDKTVTKTTDNSTPLGVLIDKSKNFTNENQQFVTPSSKDRDHENHMHSAKKEVPLLQRLRVIKASGCSHIMTPQKPLPQEVIIGNNDDDDALGARTVFSDLGVDGIPSMSTADRRRPVKFTFDGVVPSRSSLDETDSHPEEITVGQGCFEREEEVDRTRYPTAILDGLEYEIDAPVSPTYDVAMKVIYDNDVKGRERCPSAGTTSSELSIELSESQYLRICEAEVDEKYNIFSPRSSSVGEEPCPLDHGYDVVSKSTSNGKKDETTQGVVSSSSWIDFSFLRIW